MATTASRSAMPAPPRSPRPRPRPPSIWTGRGWRWSIAASRRSSPTASSAPRCRRGRARSRGAGAWPIRSAPNSPSCAPVLWPGLLQTARYNQARQQERVRIFETGLRFRPGPDGSAPGARRSAAWSSAAWTRSNGAQPARPADFYRPQGRCRGPARPDRRVRRGFRFVPAEHPALHPGQTRAHRARRAGRSGSWGCCTRPWPRSSISTATPFCSSWTLAPLATGVLPGFTPDLALPGDPPRPGDRGRCGRRLTARSPPAFAPPPPDLLRELVLFDVYAGQNIDSGRKSLALGLILQASSQTLTDRSR